MGVRLAHMLDGDSQSLDKSDTHNTAAFETNRCGGAMAIQVVSSAGSITVTQQVCETKTGTFLSPVSSANAALGAIAAGMTVGTRYVSIDPVPAPWSRLNIIEGGTAATVVVCDVWMLLED
jgi:hypothetical protein